MMVAVVDSRVALAAAVGVGVFALLIAFYTGWLFGKRDEQKRGGEWVDSVESTVLEGLALTIPAVFVGLWAAFVTSAFDEGKTLLGVIVGGVPLTVIGG